MNRREFIEAMDMMDLFEEQYEEEEIKKTKEYKKHRLFLRIAQEFANESKDPKFKVGCVIVTPNFVLYPGYNGDERGGTNQRDSMDHGQSGFVHAEANAITKFDPSIHKHSKMYLTYNPCVVCARMIINCGAIDEVYYLNRYEKDMRGVGILKKSGIKCEQIPG